MIKKYIALTLMISLFLCSCSMFNWSNTPLRVQASEPDAKIYVNGNYMGDGAIQTRVPRRSDTSILIKKNGFRPVQRDLAYRLGTVGLVDLIFGFVFLLPWIGLAFPGAYVLDQENVTVLMERE